MNSSAKLTSVLLAVGALGVAVFSGCTVNSTTSNDLDGGTSSSGSSSGGSSSGSTSTSDAGDAGDAAPAIPVGEACAGNNQKEGLVSTSCQTCLEQKCCTELKGCFNITVSDNTKVDCEEHSRCVSDCQENPGPSGDSLKCEADNCTPTAGDGIPAAYDKIVTCGETKCATECGL